ncbi:MAG: hypothetical protein A3C08_02265 [Candidatus Taylorbacteria bacterium RIFCSPHIGHO2_02_FULL_47_18]|uniref:Uncharacterized protein n=1 Tax=Candidatus Taylorbacteria bacterium RIFCSPLOWO2_01_FULL_48_100 TaxID=1802322 RepID=A0A1G2NDL2_9BACT|nr:MAG: hypothetical protein A3C08_02265 [Candidatus Taylorbacteria bacterium RIFCSPHIGHO2_02_FULL_47_18]OHA34195.1 MAG: hypothetical protein A2938_00765 [Candidatus Taylorbacteria bacterium RIFCSPLOWO2_01_FULL_48_100]OHA40785.1 MAG: hypothetical protein A3J31_00555 [Candidatus Taylorbacteria bacterium RIFCSPLOWO2_02_FULL_48_16]OHA45354.1 MAG: hypothetical protein A3H13_00880 [Candidatus Taylorbacteria bacterium RIFCSPLOWO2_12_FULL_48_11]
MSALTENQKQLLEKVRRESRHRAQRVIQHAKLRKNQKRKLRLAKQQLEQSDIIINIDLREQYRDKSIIDSLLTIGRVFNLIEIGNFQVASTTKLSEPDCWLSLSSMERRKTYRSSSAICTIRNDRTMGLLITFKHRPH